MAPPGFTSNVGIPEVFGIETLNFIGLYNSHSRGEGEERAGTQLFLVGMCPRGGTQLFFGGYVPRGFPKVGSREWVFLEKLGALGAKIQKLCVLELKFWQKKQNRAENGHFFYNCKWGGAHEQHIDGKLVG